MFEIKVSGIVLERTSKCLQGSVNDYLFMEINFILIDEEGGASTLH